MASFFSLFLDIINRFDYFFVDFAPPLGLRLPRKLASGDFGCTGDYSRRFTGVFEFSGMIIH